MAYQASAGEEKKENSRMRMKAAKKTAKQRGVNRKRRGEKWRKANQQSNMVSSP